MHENFAVAIAAIITAGVLAQWLASWLRIPSVILLLPAGVILGPVTGLVDPSVLFGDALFTVIAIAVGLILFEGGLGLRLSKVRVVGRPVIGLITVGVGITWVVASLAASALLSLPRGLSLLVGAILVVSGPTVVLPLLETLKLREPVSSILRWECILIDPVGAVLAVAVFEAIVDSGAGFNPLATISVSAAIGILVGCVCGFGLAGLFRSHLVPDRLHNPLTLAVVICCFVIANELGVEAGLFATTVMGIVVANQRFAPVAHVAAFGEDLSVLVLGGLFVVLGATVDFDAMRSVALPAIGLLVVLLALRPAVVFVTTFGAKLTNLDRLYLGAIAPRGVVAASVAALFTVSLQAENVEGASVLAPAMFVVIIGSVLFSSIVARPLSRRLRVAAPEGQGILLAGDQSWLLDLGIELANHEVAVMMFTTADDDDSAPENGLLTYSGAMERKELARAIEAVGVSNAIVTLDEGATGTFLTEALSEILGRSHVYVVTEDQPRRGLSSRAWGRPAFAGKMDHDRDRQWSIVIGVPAIDAPADPAKVALVHLTDDGPVVVSRRLPRSVTKAPTTVIFAEPAPESSSSAEPAPRESSSHSPSATGH